MRIEGSSDQVNMANINQTESTNLEFSDELDPRIKILLYAYFSRLAELHSKKPLTDADLKELAKIYEQLSKLEEEGYTDPKTGKLFKIDKDAYNKIEDLKNKLAEDMGIPVPKHPDKWPVPTQEQIEKWQSRAELPGFLSRNRDAFYPGLMAFIEFKFISETNAIVFGEIEKLNDAIKVFKEVLELLDAIQKFKSRLKPGALDQEHTIEIPAGSGKKYTGTLDDLLNKRGGFSNFPQDANLMKQAYEKLAELSFNPIEAGLPQLTDEVYEEFLILVGRLGRLIEKLEKLPLVKGIDAESIKDLVDALKTIHTDMSSGGAALATWLLDGYGKGGNEGKNQRNISDAITRTQGVNDEAKKELQPKFATWESLFKTLAEVVSSMHQGTMSAAKKAAGG